MNAEEVFDGRFGASPSPAGAAKWTPWGGRPTWRDIYLERLALFNIQLRDSRFCAPYSVASEVIWSLYSSVNDYAMAIPDRGPQVEACAITFLILSWIAVCLRCYVKHYMIKMFRIDDWLAVLSLVRLVGFRNWVKLTAR
jgi:hypothetical protein